MPTAHHTVFCKPQKIKRMKKLLKFILYFILFILVVLIVTPVLFKGKIIKIAEEQINNSINAKAQFDDISLSFFKNFPYLNAGIKELTVSGIGIFEGDTLFSVKSIDVAINVISAIKMENIKVKKIAVNSPKINAIVLENGKANWDIAKETEAVPEVEETPDTTGSGFEATIALKKFSINDASIYYTDLEGEMSASLENFNFDLSGDLSQDFSSLIIASETEKLNFSMSGIKYLRDVILKLNVDVDADLKNNNYTLRDNSMALNDFILTLNGNVEIADSGDMAFDLKYATNKASFKSLLSLVPAVYMREFEDLTASGEIGLNGTVKGLLTENVTPDVIGQLKVSNASFSYPELPKKAEKINIDIDYLYDGKEMDNTTLNVNKFYVEFGGNPIDLKLNLRTPITDPFINSQLSANINLANLADIIPLEDTKIKGEINANIDMMGNLSLIENEQYEDFKASGTIEINDFLYTSPDVPKPFSIAQANIGISPKHLNVGNFTASMGRSDFSITGSVSDFLPYVYKDQTLFGELTFKSDLLDLNELMPDSGTEDEPSASNETMEEESSSDSSTNTAIEVPANINFTLQSSIAKLFYDEMELENIEGKIYIKDQKVVMEKLAMNAFDGSMLVSGEYNTQDIDNPLVDFNLQADKIDIPMTLASFGVLGKIAPIASKATGKISLGMQYSSFLNDAMKPILKTIVGGGNMASEQIKVTGSNAFQAIGSKLNLDAFKELILKDLDMDFKILAGKLLVDPFETNMGNTNFMISGSQDLSNQLDYGISIKAPKTLFGTANSKLNELYAANPIKGFDIKSSETVNLLVNVTGDMAKPSIKINPMASTKEAGKAIKQELKATVQQNINEQKAEAKAKAKAEAAKIIAEAEKQAAEIRKQGKVAADKVRSEANANAQRMVNEAKNPILKKVAETGAKEVRNEGEKKAQTIESEAEKKANSIIANAQRKADQMLK